MQFTRFVFDNYLQTDEGREALQFFKSFPKYVTEGDPNNTIKRFVDNLLLIPLANEWYHFDQAFPQEVMYNDFEEFSEDVINRIRQTLVEDGGTFRDILEDIPNFSVSLYAESQQFAFPYLYPVHFFRIQEICDILGILLPPLPAKTRYEDKCLFYLKLCKVFYEFRCQFQLSPDEFCVLLYCFAQHFLSNPLCDELPTPLKSYIVGANSGIDEEYLRTISPMSVRYWQGNIETKLGDIILMYELSPKSQIGSVWRAITPGYDDPFRYYSGVIWIAHPTSIPPITLNELRENPVWSQKGLVKANMQGVAGRPCSQEEYTALLDILRHKNFDISLLPTLTNGAPNIDILLLNERDVEIYLLEPFLKRLGLNERDWIRQMPLRMGRGIRYYPDYVIHADTERGNEKGAIVCEAKFRIPNNKQLKEDFFQAKSYARRLDCLGLILASCEGVWLSLAQDDYNFEKLLFLGWGELVNPDIFSGFKIELDKLLKRRATK